jgi:hypothetical protein
MALLGPKEIMADFSQVIDKLQTAKGPLSAAEQHELATRLSEAYNFLSAQSAKPSLANVLRSQSANVERIIKQEDKQSD